MIEIVSIEVQNFRSFNHAVFAPLGIGQGLTAINGPNGSGKSSIATHGLIWALYGQTPDGVTVKGLRRQDSEGEVRVSVTFRHDGQTVTVTRALRGRNDTTAAAISVDGVEQTNVSAKTATAWVTERLGIDAEAFITAFVVRQKEVDALVKARPAERRTLVERLAGIDRMSLALAKARENARNLSLVASAHRDSIDVAAAEKRLVDTEALVAELETELAEATALHEERSRQATEAEKVLTEASAAAKKINDAEHAVALSRQEKRNLDNELDRLERESEGAELLADAQANAADAREARAAAERVISDVKSAVDVARHLEESAAKAVEEADELAAKEKTLTAELDALNSELDALPDDVEDRIVEAEEQIDDYTSRLGAVQGERDRVSRAIEALTIASGVGHAECPTCSHPLEDASALLSQMKEDLELLSKKASSVLGDLTQGKELLVELKSSQRKRGFVKSERDKAVIALASAERETQQAYARAHKVEEDAETVAEEAHEASSKAAESERELPGLLKAEQDAQKALRKAETAAEAEAKIPAMQVRVDKASSSLEVLETQLELLESGVVVDVDAAREQADEAREAARDALVVFKEAQQAHALSVRESSEASKAVEEAKEQAQAKRDALAAAEMAHAVAVALEEFRKDRIARLAPELSEVASDVVSTMTEGRYTTVELDEDFTPILTEAATGQQRPTAWLSGGEESAVALALRIAIGEVVSGQKAGLLVLDEVLTAHDPLRRAAVMSAIRSLDARQVITINHVSEATDMVDYVAHVIPDVEGGSTLEYSAGGAASDSIIVDSDIPEDDD